MKIRHLLGVGALALLLVTGCSKGPRPPRGDSVDTSLPVISVAGHLEDMTSVSFEWNQITDENVEGILVYRDKQRGNDPQLKRYDIIPSRYYTHYTDNNLKPNTKYEYSFTTFSKKAESEKSYIITVVTPPILDSVSWLKAVQNMPRVVKILWQPIENPIVNGYIIEKKSPNELNFKELAKVKGRLNMEYVDEDLQDGQQYEYRIKAYTFNDITSHPSDSVQAITKQLPPDVTGLHITNNLSKKIQLSWDPVDMQDFDYYKVYRSRSSRGYADYYAKVADNNFTDDVDKDGAQYFYKVTAVDKDGLEGNPQVPLVRGASIPAIQVPTSVKIQVTDKKLEVSWEDDDPRVVSYNIIKSTRTGWLKGAEEILIKDVKTKIYTDEDVYSGNRYGYQIIALDKNGIESEPSPVVQIRSKNLQDKNKLKEDTNTTQPPKDTNTTQPAKNTKPTVNDTNSTIKAAPNLDTSTL